MATMLKECIFIVNHLNDEPFLKNLSFATFEGFSPAKLIEVLNEVLTEIKPKHPESLKGKVAEERVSEIFNLLSILEYEPIKDCCDEIRRGLEEKSKAVIYPILCWLLGNIPVLKRKAYIAQFTIELEVPIHLQKNENIRKCMNEQKELIQAFKQRLEDYETLQPASVAKDKVMADCKKMQINRRSLLSRRDSLLRELESSGKASEDLINATRELRLEMQREKELTQQSKRQDELLAQEKKKLFELEKQNRGEPTADVNRANIMAEFQKDIEANTAKVKVKRLELEKMREKVSMLQAMADAPFITAANFIGMKSKVDEVKVQINKHNVEMAISQAFDEERLNSLRQQASLIHQKKNAKAKELQERRERLECAQRKLQQDNQDRRRSVRDLQECNKDTLTKKCEDLAQLKVKHDDLKREQRSLKQKDQYIQPLLRILEAEKGKPGLSDAQKVLERMVAIKSKGYSQTDKSKMKKLELVASLRSNLPALKEECSLMRQQCYELADRYRKQKGSGAKGLKQKTAEMEKQFMDKKALLEITVVKTGAAIAQLKALSPPTRQQTPKIVKAKGKKSHDPLIKR